MASYHFLPPFGPRGTTLLVDSVMFQRHPISGNNYAVNCPGFEF